MPTRYNTALPLFLSAFLFSSQKDSTKPGICFPSLFKPRCSVQQDALLKKHINQETGKARGKKQKRKSQNKLMCDPALLESLQEVTLASKTIIDGL